MGFVSSFAIISTRFIRLSGGSPKNPIRLYAAAAAPSKSSSKSSPSSLVGGKNGDGGPSLVIFDKDGTLICFHTMWTPWVMGIAHGLEVGTGLAHAGLGLDVFRLLGVTSHTHPVRVGPGLLAESTMPDIKARLTQMLAIYGFQTRCANEIIDAVWHENETQLHAGSIAVKPIIDDLPELFRLLRSHRFKIAVCTADNRKSTEHTLKYLQLTNLVDGVICGDDEDSKPKPNPYNVAKLCRDLNVPPWRTYVVGDTLADLRMGKEAGVAASIGVVSGVGSRDHLAPFADHIVDTVRDIVPIVIGDEKVRDAAYSIGDSGTESSDEEDQYNEMRRRQYSTPLFAYMHSMKQLM